MSQFFEFEQDFVTSLRCIPMVMRYKLDTCGVKMKLEHWGQFDEIEKQRFIDMPCENPAEAQAYHDALQQLIEAKTGSKAKVLAINPQAPWLGDEIPEVVNEKAQSCQVTIEPEQWQTLTPLQKFALIKLSRPSHENRNFVPALKEFGLL